MDTYDLTCEFDVQRHKEKYINYLEVMIEADGHVVYAVPSHQEKAIALAMVKYEKTRDEIANMCPKDMYFDFLTWLLRITGTIAVWYNGYMGEPNRKQINKLKSLKLQGVYKGSIPAENRTNAALY